MANPIADDEPPSAVLEREFERRLSNVSGASPVFPHAAKEQMRAMLEQIARTDKNLARVRSTDQSVKVRAGFAAEEWHAETFNLDAILKNDGSRAYTDKCREFGHAGHQVNGTADVVVFQDGQAVHEAQAKYYASAEKTYGEMRQVDADGVIKYEGMDSLIGPSDQVEKVADIARRNRIKEEAKGTRPAVEKAAGMVEEKATATLKVGETESTPLSKAEAEALARDGAAKVKTTVEDRYKTASTLTKMQEAAAGAAAMSAIIAGTINIFTNVRLVREGKLEPSEAAIRIAAETAASAADSALKAAATTGAHSLLVRYGSQELVRKLAGQGAAALVRSNAVSVAVVCTIDLIKDLVLFGAGRITASQLEERAGKGVLTTSAGVLGGTLGGLACGGMASGVFVVGAVPLIGSIAGGLICSMAMELAVENGIEAPYRELVSNAVALRAAAQLLDEVARQILEGQVAFESALLKETALDERFQQEAECGATLNAIMQRAIDRI